LDELDCGKLRNENTPTLILCNKGKGWIANFAKFIKIKKN
jgi:hypothetical protein